MRLNEVTYSGTTPVDGYGPGFFRIGGARHDGALTLLPSGLESWTGWDAVEPLLAAAADIDVLLVGTGAEIAHAPTAFRDALEAAGIGVEVMATPQACRTYNVLLGEGRRVGAAVFPV